MMKISIWPVLGMALLTAAAAYLLGCFNGAVLVSKYLLHDDVRKHGSGNAGLTNFFRTFGGPLTLVVVLCDALKAAVAVLLGGWLLGFVHPAFGRYWAALFCLLGHMFPCMFHFKGGKGILSGGTAVWFLDWRVALVVWGGFLLLVLLTRYVSLGSCWAGASFPFATLFFSRSWTLTALAVVTGALILWQHRGNIRRLLHGSENKLSFHHKHGGT